MRSLSRSSSCITTVEQIGDEDVVVVAGNTCWQTVSSASWRVSVVVYAEDRSCPVMVKYLPVS